jgi:UDP-glucose 4-epimerase
MNEKVVITGGAGFIGSHLAQHFLNEGFHVTLVDSFATGHRRNLDAIKGDVELVEADVRDRDALDDAFRGARYVLHQAALVSVPLSCERPFEAHAVNGTGTLNVFEAARLAGVERVTFAASAAAYGDKPALPTDESQPVAPLSPYAATKLLGEHYAAVYTAQYGLPVFPLRYFNIYGPRQDPAGAYAAVISKFYERMKAGGRPVIFGNGQQTRDFCYVGDVVQANAKALTAPVKHAGQPINIGTGCATTLLDLVDGLNRAFGTALEPVFREKRAGDVTDSLADISRARAWLGYQPTFTIGDGLATMR